MHCTHADPAKMSFGPCNIPAYRDGNFLTEIAMRELNDLSVKIHGGAAELCLERGQTVNLSNARDTHVECESGVLWLTQYDDRNDVVLKAGESFVVDHDGLSIVQVFEHAKIRFTGPHTTHESTVLETLLHRLGEFVPVFHKTEAQAT
jgi:hypothetical protein